MQVVYSDMPQIEAGVPSIFLAGPTPRTASVASWRPEAVSILEKLGFTGSVLIPERRDWSTLEHYDDQFLWELTGLDRCSVIVFWVPRQFPDMPALTTNVEFGHFLTRKPVVYGRPPGIRQNRYLDRLFKYYELSNGPHDDLETTLKDAVSDSMDYAYRK